MAINSKAISNQWQLFQLALMFFTRLPVSKALDYSAERLNQSNRYFSLVGIVVALLFVVCFELAQQFWSAEVALVIAMISGFLVTGGFHEDGLADAADGIAGGLTRESRLVIMKDSRIGTYGVLALFSVLLLKYQLLLSLWSVSHQTIVFLFGVLSAHSLSRAIAGSLIYNTPYVSPEDNSKSKPLAAQQNKTELRILLVLGALPLLGFLTNDYFWSLVFWLSLSLVLFRSYARVWLFKRIGGITGDCLGAVQQITELLVYLILLAVLS